MFSDRLLERNQGKGPPTEIVEFLFGPTDEPVRWNRVKFVSDWPAIEKLIQLL
jgi:hypothetical protein